MKDLLQEYALQPDTLFDNKPLPPGFPSGLTNGIVSLQLSRFHSAEVDDETDLFPRGIAILGERQVNALYWVLGGKTLFARPGELSSWISSGGVADNSAVTVKLVSEDTTSSVVLYKQTWEGSNEHWSFNDGRAYGQRWMLAYFKRKRIYLEFIAKALHVLRDCHVQHLALIEAMMYEGNIWAESNVNLKEYIQLAEKNPKVAEHFNETTDRLKRVWKSKLCNTVLRINELLRTEALHLHITFHDKQSVTTPTLQLQPTTDEAKQRGEGVNKIILYLGMLYLFQPPFIILDPDVEYHPHIGRWLGRFAQVFLCKREGTKQGAAATTAFIQGLTVDQLHAWDTCVANKKLQFRPLGKTHVAHPPHPSTTTPITLDSDDDVIVLSSSEEEPTAASHDRPLDIIEQPHKVSSSKKSLLKRPLLSTVVPPTETPVFPLLATHKHPTKQTNPKSQQPTTTTTTSSHQTPKQPQDDLQSEDAFGPDSDHDNSNDSSTFSSSTGGSGSGSGGDGNATADSSSSGEVPLLKRRRKTERTTTSSTTGKPKRLRKEKSKKMRTPKTKKLTKAITMTMALTNNIKEVDRDDLAALKLAFLSNGKSPFEKPVPMYGYSFYEGAKRTQCYLQSKYPDQLYPKAKQYLEMGHSGEIHLYRLLKYVQQQLRTGGVGDVLPGLETGVTEFVTIPEEFDVDRGDLDNLPAALPKKEKGL